MIKITVRRVRGQVDRVGAMATARQVAVPLVTGTCRKIMNQATINCPVDTGNLRGHHRMAVRDLKTKTEGRVFNDAEYAAIVHNGGQTPPHTIKARRKKALAFNYAGRKIIVRSVRHPGSTVKGRPWLATAAEQVAIREGFRFTRQ